MQIGNTITLMADVTVTSGASDSVTWRSIGEAVATVDSITGLVTGVAPGTANIIATSTVDTTKADTLEITVPTPTVDSVSIAGNDTVFGESHDSFNDQCCNEIRCFGLRNLE